jgi:elongation factor Ts
MSNASLVKQLRDETGAGFMDCKRAIEQADGDLDAAKKLLREWGLAGVAKRAGRSAKEGGIFHYTHQLDPDIPAKVGVLVECNCETDFVAKTDEFKELGRSLAKQVAAMEPRWITDEDVPKELLDEWRDEIGRSDAVQGKPDDVKDKIIEGKISSRLSDKGGVLLAQPFFLDDSGKRTVGDLIGEIAVTVKENIQVARFARFRLGEEE